MSRRNPKKIHGTDGTEIVAKVKAKYLAMLAPFVSTQETRFNLNGVFVQRHATLPGCMLVATDGHVLGAVWDPDAEALRDAIWPLPKALAAACRKSGVGEGYVEFDGSRAALYDPAWHLLHLAISTPIDGDYPEWRRGVPEPPKKTTGEVWFDPELLGRFAKVGKPVRMQAACPDGPVLIRVESVPEFLGAVMPMRGDNHFPQALPGWVPAKPKGREPAAKKAAAKKSPAKTAKAA